MDTCGKQITKEAQLLASLQKNMHFLPISALALKKNKFNTKLWEKQTGQKGKFWLVSSLCFWTVVLEKTLQSSLDRRRSNQSTLKEISPEYSLEGLMLKLSSNTLATWCEEQTHWKRPWCWGKLRARGEARDRGWDGWMASLTQWTWVWVTSGY